MLHCEDATPSAVQTDPATTARTRGKRNKGSKRLEINRVRALKGRPILYSNRDLPVGLVQTFAALGIAMTRPSPQATDYDSVNGVLATTEASVAETYFTPLMKTLHRDFDGLDDIAANWSLREARAAAWTSGATLWNLRAETTLSRDYVDALDGIVGFGGRGLLVPTG